MVVAFWRNAIRIAASLVALLTLAKAGLALSAADLPPVAPEQRVLDSSGVLSWAVTSELERNLGELKEADRVDPRLVTVPRLDYGLSLQTLADELTERWGEGERDASNLSGPNLLLLVIDSQNKSAAISVSEGLRDQLPASLLHRIARETMAPPLRDGARYRQASMDALDRLSTVLSGREDPGPPGVAEQQLIQSNVPSREETEQSNAFTWVLLLLVVGTVMPLATWWVFSR